LFAEMPAKHGNRAAHLAVRAGSFHHFAYWSRHSTLASSLSPSRLHPAAAESFSEILRGRLRSLLCVTEFHSRVRGIGDLKGGIPFHFAHTFPLCRRGPPASAFSWLETDPRPGIDVDLANVPLSEDPRHSARGWELMEQAFGIGERGADDPFRFYICPSLNWPRGIGSWEPADYVAQQAPWREGLGMHLADEAAMWQIHRSTALTTPGNTGPIPAHGTVVDAETFEAMGAAPSLALGMWLFPPEAFNKTRGDRHLYNFDLSAARPGLILFDPPPLPASGARGNPRMEEDPWANWAIPPPSVR
jgi:hypothetical protein